MVEKLKAGIVVFSAISSSASTLVFNNSVNATPYEIKTN